MSEVLLHDLLERTLEGRLSEADAAELTQLLRSSPAALRSYWECVANHAFIEDVLRESRGRDLALLEHEVKPDPAVSRRRSARWRFSRRRFSRRQRGIALIVASLVCVAAWLGYLSLRPARDDVQVAELQAMSGVVKVRDSGGRLKPASSGARIGRGEAIVVEEDQGSAEVVLDDGSQIHLDADSILSFLAPEDMATSHLHLERGGLLAETGPREEPLIVTTDHASVTVLGTRFRLYSDAVMSRVELDEGSLEFKQEKDGQTVEVAEGYYAVALGRDELRSETEALAALPLSQATCQLRSTLLRAGQVGCLSHDGQWLATSRKRQMRVWSLDSGEPLESLTHAAHSHFHQLAFSPDDRSLVALGPSGTAAIWRRGEAAASYFTLRSRHVRYGTVAPDGRRIGQAVADEAGEVAVWKVNVDDPGVSLESSLPIKPWNVAITPDEPQPFVAAGCWNGDIEVAEATSGRPHSRLRASGTPHPLALSNDGRYVAAFGNKEGLVLFDRRSGETSDRIERRQLWSNSGARVACLRFSADGRLLLAGMDDGLVRVWSTRTGESLLVLETGDSRVAWLDLSSDGRFLATGGREDSVRIWNCLWPDEA